MSSAGAAAVAQLPVLYSFRRCPFAMRARIALCVSGTQCEVREVALRAKPPSLLRHSPKATVPVLVLPDGRVIDESLDIVRWALAKTGVEGTPEQLAMVHECDGEFQRLLKRYKYHHRFPEETKDGHRAVLEEAFLSKYEAMLREGASGYFCGTARSLPDVCMLPLVRQMALVDEQWFFQSRYTCLAAWLRRAMDASWFEDVVMRKNDPWQDPLLGGDAAPPVLFLPPEGQGDSVVE